MKWFIGFLTNWWGSLLMVILLLNFGLQYGNRWECGQYGMPRTLVAPDGVSYPDGKVIDPITASLIRAGVEEEVFLGMLIFSALSLVITLRIMCDTEKKHRQLRESFESLAAEYERRRNSHVS